MARSALTPRPTSTPHRKMTTDTTVAAMNRNTNCLPFSWISCNPSSELVWCSLCRILAPFSGEYKPHEDSAPVPNARSFYSTADPPAARLSEGETS